jgi:DNA-binding MarR family transcriptional regulator
VAYAQTDFGILLALTYASFVEELRIEHAQQGFDDLGGSYGYVFRALEHEELSAAQLADRLGVRDQALTRVIDGMERKGYVERVRDEHDRRVKRLRLGERGRAALAVAHEFHARYERDLGTRIGRDRVVALRATLEGLLADRDEDALARLLRPM